MSRPADPRGGVPNPCKRLATAIPVLSPRPSLATGATAAVAGDCGGDCAGVYLGADFRRAEHDRPDAVLRGHRRLTVRPLM